MDNVPNWEFGVLVQVRDMARTLRNNLSRSQSQSSEDVALVSTENQFYFDNDSWILPATESEYKKGMESLQDYLIRLGDKDSPDAQFYARADNLGIWLSEVETRLGSLSQRLSASVGKHQLNTALAGDSAATQSTESAQSSHMKTPWMELDDVFYEARGTTWALIHLLRAVEVDFQEVLQKKKRPDQFAAYHQGTGTRPGHPVESGHPERQRTGNNGKSFAGDGFTHFQGQCCNH